MNRGLVVTIDGAAGTGKSTAARRLAEVLGWQFCTAKKNSSARKVVAEELPTGMPTEALTEVTDGGGRQMLGLTS